MAIYAPLLIVVLAGCAPMPSMQYGACLPPMPEKTRPIDTQIEKVRDLRLSKYCRTRGLKLRCGTTW